MTRDVDKSLFLTRRLRTVAVPLTLQAAMTVPFPSAWGIATLHHPRAVHPGCRLCASASFSTWPPDDVIWGNPNSDKVYLQ